ncbi:MAG: protein kinase, partial [Chloroflexi bacterium]|nr:protein kinase [Chloroflexota bacterium]
MTNSETVLGKYRIKEELRKRREGVVYLGVDIEINQAVIFTVLDAELIHPQQFLARFELIAETLKGIDSPYGAALLDYGEQEGQAIIVQEYVEGQSLSEMLTDSDGLPENLVLDIAQQVGEYLRDLHQADLLHGSLSPDTILLTSKGTVQVRDAGLAQGMNLNQLLADGNIGASPIHAPETRSGGELTPATDFYALGATLFDLLTGEKLELEPADLWPGNKRQGLSPELDELVFKCLQVDPARRMQSAAELLNGIQETRRGSQAGGQDTILGMEDVLVGHTLGAYQLTERLGQGGMATVYKAYEPALDRYVAIKVLPQFFARDPNFMNRFRREAKAVAQLNHPSIMPIYSYGEEGDITYIAMQYVPGGTLKQGRGQVYEPAEGIRLALPIVRALAYAHQRGIVHRDIKPSNVLLGENDWPVLADFGLAKMAEASQQLTGTGVGVGTPMYMSPEQGQGTDVDHRTDIYSMGIMLYEMLTGDVPFRADTPMAVVIKHMTAPLPMPREANPGIPEALERIILKATAKSADDRYQTAEEMITALERVQNSLLAPTRDAEAADVTVPALREPETPPPPREAAPLARTLKKAGIILGGIIGVLLLGLILMWVFDICPPEGPWPIPPWCPGSTYKLPTIGGEEETPAVITDGDLGSILFQEDFDDSLSNRWTFWPTAWGMEQESGRSVLRSAPLDLSISETITAEIRGTNWQNYAIEFDFRFSQPDQFGAHYFWVIGRITDCPPNVHAMQGYGTLISPDEVTLVKDTCVAGSRQTIEKSDKDIVVEGWHTLQYIFIGNRVQLYIDGEKYADYTDATDPLDGGDLWIELVGDSELMIDNLKVYEVIPGEGGLEGVVSPTSLCAPGETLLFYEDFESGYQDGWYFQNAAGEETEPWSIVDDGTGNYVIQGHEHNLAHYTGFRGRLCEECGMKSISVTL